MPGQADVSCSLRWKIKAGTISCISEQIFRFISEGHHTNTSVFKKLVGHLTLQLLLSFYGHCKNDRLVDAGALLVLCQIEEIIKQLHREIHPLEHGVKKMQ